MISNVETGRSALLLDGAVKAAQTLGVSLDYLTGLTDDERPAAQLAARVNELQDAQARPTGAAGSARVLPFARPGIRTVPFVQGAGIAAGAGAAAVILVDCQRTTRRRDKVFAVRTDDGPVVKRLRHDEAGWRLMSDNRAYAPRSWPAHGRVIGQVMWTGRTL